MVPRPVAGHPPSGRNEDILTAEELARRLHIDRVQTIRDLCAAGLVPGTSKVGHEWRIHWRTFYVSLAGPGVAAGEIVNSRQLAARLGVSARVVLRASAPPGTPGKLPGLRLGKSWFYAIPAVQAQIGWPLDEPVPAGRLPGDDEDRATSRAGHLPARSRPAWALDHPGPAASPQAAARSRPRASGVSPRRRRARPETRPGPGQGTASR